MTPADLIAAAAASLRGRRGTPKLAVLKRAISTAYYATFHAAARLAADMLVGRTKAATDAWSLTYRGLQHGYAKDMLGRRDVQALDVGVASFADVFTELQELRHRADYDPRSSFTLAQARAAVDDARDAITALANVPAATRLDLAARLLFRPRA